MLIYGANRTGKRSSKGMEKRGQKRWLCTYNGIPPRGTQELNRCGKTRE